MTALPLPETPYVGTITLVAVPTAAACGRAFVRDRLARWQVEDLADDALLVASELVSNAVTAVGFGDRVPRAWEITGRQVIGLQLRLVRADLFVEVWDGAAGLPEPCAAALDAEGGRGLLLVESVCRTWGVFRPAVGGKVVWAQIPLPREPVFSGRTGEAPLLPRRPPDQATVHELAGTALLQRVLDGLRHLH
ncbi:ATP-binding protein [Streptomyces sp. NPDC086091]|uniref:ATP-binding protein n=1 Tax=Streptomyces sp. NPDC086091 TaxID=3365751 RepID=UPI0038009232